MKKTLNHKDKAYNECKFGLNFLPKKSLLFMLSDQFHFKAIIKEELVKRGYDYSGKFIGKNKAKKYHKTMLQLGGGEKFHYQNGISIIFNKNENNS